MGLLLKSTRSSSGIFECRKHKICMSVIYKYNNCHQWQTRARAYLLQADKNFKPHICSLYNLMTHRLLNSIPRQVISIVCKTSLKINLQHYKKIILQPQTCMKYNCNSVVRYYTKTYKRDSNIRTR